MHLRLLANGVPAPEVPGANGISRCAGAPSDKKWAGFQAGPLPRVDQNGQNACKLHPSAAYAQVNTARPGVPCEACPLQAGGNGQNWDPLHPRCNREVRRVANLGLCILRASSFGRLAGLRTVWGKAEGVVMRFVHRHSVRSRPRSCARPEQRLAPRSQHAHV